MKSPGEIIQAAQQEGRKALFEHEAKDLARAMGIVVPRYILAGPDDPKDVAAAGDKLGYPVVLKAESPDILHKTEAGAVILNITTSAGLSASVTTIRNMVAARVPGAVISSFLVEKMMPQGIELLVGGLRDQQFGPSVSFGLGGIWVEALKDAAFGILPMTREEMLAMIDETRAGTFLRGVRGSQPLDIDSVLSVLSAVAKILKDFPAVKEIDMNPVRVYPRSAAALDVRIVLE